jgi:cytochrome c
MSRVVVLVLLVTLSSVIFAACAPGGAQPTAAPGQTKVATGDPKRGEEIFFKKSDCSTCHYPDKNYDQVLVGPGLKDLFKRQNLGNGKPVNDQNVKEWIKSGGTGKIGTMPSHPDLTDQQVNDLLAYLKSLN